MKPTILFTVLLASLLASSQKIPKQYTIEQFYKTTAFGGGSFNAAENKLLIQDNSSGIFNVYEINLATGAKQQLTTSTKESFFAEDYVWGTTFFTYSADKGGNENTHIYLQTAKEKAIDLTPGEKEKASFMRWDKTRNIMYYTTNVRDPKYFDIYKMNVMKGRKPELLYQNDKGYETGLISADENYLSVIKSITTDKSELYLLNRSTNETVMLSNGSEATYFPAAFEPDNSAFYYGTNEGEEFAYVVKYDLKTKQKTKLFSTNWDVAAMNISWNGKYHYIITNQDGRNKVRLFDHKTGDEISFPELPKGTYVQSLEISPSENKMIVYAVGDRSPMNLFFYDMQTKKLKQLTYALNPEINADDLVDAQVVRFKSFDGLEVPAIYYKPQTASAKTKVPALVWVHGGPGGQSRAGYSQSIQYFVNHGYAVLAVNNRGSSGYGKSFYKMDNRNHGDKDLKDCVWGRKWLASQADIENDKIGIYGGSYGGFMSLAGIIQYPNEFAVGVDLFGVTNWLRTLKSIPPYWESFRKALYDEMGDPATDSARLKNISPLYNTDKIRTPLLVLQGSNDPRVLQVESDEIVAGAKRNNVPVEYVLFPDEGHGFVKKENQMKAARVTLEFLNKHLLTARPGKPRPSF